MPKGPLGQIWDERVRDYIEEPPRHVQLYLDYREQYHKKICSKRTHARQARRKCALLIPGFTEQHCRHIDLAFASKYRAVIRRRHESHPFMQRILLNMELERRRKEGERGGQGGKARRHDARGERRAAPPWWPRQATGARRIPRRPHTGKERVPARPGRPRGGHHTRHAAPGLKWWAGRDSNSRPLPCRGSILTN